MSLSVRHLTDMETAKAVRAGTSVVLHAPDDLSYHFKLSALFGS
jgi:hypothetical protein